VDAFVLATPQMRRYIKLWLHFGPLTQRLIMRGANDGFQITAVEDGETKSLASAPFFVQKPSKLHLLPPFTCAAQRGI